MCGMDQAANTGHFSPSLRQQVEKISRAIQSVVQGDDKQSSTCESAASAAASAASSSQAPLLLARPSHSAASGDSISSQPRLKSHDDDEVSSNHSMAMNLDIPKTPLQQLIATTSSKTYDDDDKDGPVSKTTCILPSLIRNRLPLTEVPTHTLRQNLEPIINALRSLNAEILLDLKPADNGPQITRGQYVESIYNDVLPPLYGGGPATGHSCVRYLPISEVLNQYSIGIFVFAPHARIPLHDHPGMCVLSRVLYGDLQRLSLDLARDQPPARQAPSPSYSSSSSSSAHMSGSQDHTSWFSDTHAPKRHGSNKQNWLGNFFYQQARKDQNQQQPHRQQNRLPENLPTGSKLAFKNHVDYLEAPDVTMLYPFEGNLHEFVAGPNGAAVLDVLLPPYANDQERDCTFYTIHEMTSSWSKQGARTAAAVAAGKQPCYIVPTGQPENFHCISGQYKDIGGSD